MLRVKINIDPEAILLAHGLNDGGAVQRFFTENVNKRITAYMPYRSGALSSKFKRVTSPSEITISAPYARYQYFGKVMIDPAINAAGFLTKDDTWRSRKGAVKVLAERDLRYDTTKNAQAGSFWDRRMMAAEGKALLEDLKGYIRIRSRDSK